MKNMKQDIFSYLPPEIITEILLRLPVQTILRWKCVCKSWRHLFETRNFVESHHFNSLVPADIAQPDENDDKLCIHGSVDGFLLLVKYEELKCQLHLYNPITREYIDLLHSHSQSFDPLDLVYGFGVSKITGQYKVVGIFPFQKPMGGKIYTIGTGSWRSIAPHAKVSCKKGCRGEFVNGNLHWLTEDLHGKLWISCFDLETETFNDFSPPFQNDTSINTRVVAMEGTLCVYVYTYRYANQISVWLMKEYGVENSWSRQFIIERKSDIWNDSRIYPIKFFNDGIVLLCHGNSFCYYSNKDKQITKTICNFQGSAYKLHSYTPSFLSLKCFEMENVLSLGSFKVKLYFFSMAEGTRHG